jgi:hypothetical protein
VHRPLDCICVSVIYPPTAENLFDTQFIWCLNCLKHYGPVLYANHWNLSEHFVCILHGIHHLYTRYIPRLWYIPGIYMEYTRYVRISVNSIFNYSNAVIPCHGSMQFNDGNVHSNVDARKLSKCAQHDFMPVTDI